MPAVLLHNVLIKIGRNSLESNDPVINTYSMKEFAKQTVLAICLGGREPIVGAMWFVYVLFYGFDRIVYCVMADKEVSQG